MMPERENIVRALELIGQTRNGPLKLTDLDRQLDSAILVGMLDAAVEQIAQRFTVGVGRGNSRGHLVVKGYAAYMDKSGQQSGSMPALMGFFQKRLRRLAGEMQSALKAP